MRTTEKGCDAMNSEDMPTWGPHEPAPMMPGGVVGECLHCGRELEGTEENRRCIATEKFWRYDGAPDGGPDRDPEPLTTWIAERTGAYSLADDDELSCEICDCPAPPIVIDNPEWIIERHRQISLGEKRVSDITLIVCPNCPPPPP